jgi:hypothetical protein
LRPVTCVFACGRKSVLAGVDIRERLGVVFSSDEERMSIGAGDDGTTRELAEDMQDGQRARADLSTGFWR